MIDAVAASGQRVAGQGDNMKRVRHRDRVGEVPGCGGLQAGEAVRGHDLDPVADTGALASREDLNTCLGRPSGMSDGADGPVPSRDGRRVIFASSWTLNCGTVCGSQTNPQAYVVEALP